MDYFDLRFLDGQPIEFPIVLAPTDLTPRTLKPINSRISTASRIINMRLPEVIPVDLGSRDSCDHEN